MILSDLDSIVTWDAVIEAEPALAVVLSAGGFDDALLAIANFVDLKSPYTLGHARAVSELAAEAGRMLGLPERTIVTLRRAGLVHDLGRLGISNSIWDKPGPLGAGEWERVRLHPYLTERMLHQSEALAPLGADRRAAPRAARRLGVSARAERSRDLPSCSDSRRRRCLPGDARAAAIPAGALSRGGGRRVARRRQGRSPRCRGGRGVLGAAGHRVLRRREGPAGLTAREVDVLRLTARGLSNKEVAERLVISPKTVASHIEHIYVKIGASTRAGASLFAMQHGLLPEEELVPSGMAADAPGRR